MKIRTLSKQIYRSLSRHRGRVALTLLGVAIGITAVMVVFSASDGLRNFILSQLDVFGPNLIQVEVKVPSYKHESIGNAMNMALGVTITTLTMEDAEAIARLPNIDAVSAGLTGQELVSYQDQIKKTMLFGMGEQTLKLMKLNLAAGRFYSREENDGLAKVAVLGSKVKEKLFGNNEPLGKEIKIKRVNYRVIGVLEKQGMSGMMDMDSTVFLPVKTLQKSILGINHVLFIMTNVKDEKLIEDTVGEITYLLRQRHHLTDPNKSRTFPQPHQDEAGYSGKVRDKDDFTAMSMAQGKEMVETILNGIRILFLALVAISLLIGGIGIMNVMYVSVTERTFEIGLIKALGARDRDVLWQFLLEAAAITLIGGLVGIAAGVLLSLLVSLAVASQGFDFPFSISWPAILISCGFSIGVGLLFGLTPARRASRLEPVEAMRRE